MVSGVIVFFLVIYAWFLPSKWHKKFIKMVFDIGMPNIAVNPLDGHFEIVKHKKEKTRSISFKI